MRSKKIYLITRDYKDTHNLPVLDFVNEINRQAVLYQSFDNPDVSEMDAVIYWGMSIQDKGKSLNSFCKLDHHNKILISNDYHKIKKIKKNLAAYNIKHFLVFMDVPDGILFPHSLNDYYSPCEKDIDIAFMQRVSDTYPLRKAISGKLDNLGYKYIKAERSGGAKKKRGYKLKQGEYAGKSYFDMLNRCKVMLTCSSIYKYPVKKYFECMTTKCLCMADEPKSAEQLGLVDGETYVKIDKSNWKKKLDYYLNNKAERERIVENAYNLFKEKHTNEVRVKQLLKIIL